jgi:hypothetical protein
MKLIPHTTFDVLGFNLYSYELRFYGLAKDRLEFAPLFCQLSLMKMSLIIRQRYKGNIFPFKFKQDWNIHKANDFALCDVQSGHPQFYVLEHDTLFNILKTPMQFNYSYRVLYDMEKEKIGISTPLIDSIKNIGWKSLDEMDRMDYCFHEPLPVWEPYPVDIRRDYRASNKEIYYVQDENKDSEWIPIKAG